MAWTTDILLFLVVVQCSNAAPATGGAVALKQAKEIGKDVSAHMATMESIVKVPWESLLQSAPLSIFLLGQLVVISAKRDFVLHKTVNKNYTRMKYDSFRPTLIQVNNEGYNAFLAAHNNMDSIEKLMALVPTDVKQLLEFLTSKDLEPAQMAQYAQIPIDAIQKKADEAVSLTQTTYNQFFDVQLLLAEVAEVLAATQGMSEEKQRQTENDRIMAIREQEMHEARQTKMQEQLDMLNKEVDSAKNAYESAMNDIPTGFKAVFMNFVAALNPAAILGGGPLGLLISVFIPNPISRGADVIESIETANASNVTKELDVIDISLIHLAHNMQKGMTEVVDGIASGSDSITHLKVAKEGFEAVKRQMVAKDGSPWFNSISDLVTAGLEELEKFQTVIPKGVQSSEFGAAVEGAKDFILQAKKIAAAVPQAGSDVVTTSSERPIVKSAESGERFKATMAERNLRSLRQSQEKMFEKMMEDHKAMQQVMLKIGRLDLDKINYGEILDILGEAIAAVGNIKKSWDELLRFFQQVAVMTQVTLSNEVNRLLNLIKTSIKMNNVKYLLTSQRKMLQESAAGTNTVSKFLFSVSSAYMKVSRKYLMPNLAGMSQLLAIKDSSTQQQKLSEIRKESEDAQIEIQAICERHKVEFEGNMQHELQRVNEIFAKVGPHTTEDRKAVSHFEEDDDK